MMKELFATVGLSGVAFSLVKAVESNSIGWAAVAICLMIFMSGWSTGLQIARGLDRLDEIAVMVRETGRANLRERTQQ